MSERVSWMRSVVAGACVAAGLAAPGTARAADDGLPGDKDIEATLRFGFSARAPGGVNLSFSPGVAQLPNYSRCYLRIQSANRPRPLFIAGAGRRGQLDLTFAPDALMASGYTVLARGAPLIEFTEYQVTTGIVGKEIAGADWLATRGKWRLSVRRIHAIATRDSKDDLRPLVARTQVPPKRAAPEPQATLRAKMDVELQAPTGSVLLRDQDAEIVLGFGIARRYFSSRSYQTFAVSAALKVDGQQLGLKGVEAGPLEIRAVIGATDWVRSPAVGSAGLPTVGDTDDGVKEQGDEAGGEGDGRAAEGEP